MKYLCTTFCLSVLPFASLAEQQDLTEVETLPVQSQIVVSQDNSILEVQLNDKTKQTTDMSQEDEFAPTALSTWSASAFYLYNASTEKMLLVPSPGFEKGGFKANAQSASYTPEKFYDFETSASTNWTLGEDAKQNSKLLFLANASIKRRLVVAVPFLEVSQGLSFKKDYSQLSIGASSFIPTPWFFVLPKYTATYSNDNMNEFAYGVKENGWSSGWSVTALKPINKNWTFLAIYSAKKLEADLLAKSSQSESNQSFMMILSYQFNKKES
ncbi:hypothetical protein [Marinicellulosiphila megalodicopiae]|uniref:hypothetical protein n=1 Tax=Marinicellulosiphila megalodicopiae TaxID=2724896 RepID=UPI003BB1C8FA